MILTQSGWHAKSAGAVFFSEGQKDKRLQGRHEFSHKGAGTPSRAVRGSFLDRRTEGQKTEKQKEKKDKRTEETKNF